MRRFRWLLAVSMSLVFLGAAPANAYQPPDGATFNVPRPWGTKAQRWRIEQAITNAIANTPTGGTIHIASFLLDYAPGVDALINACRRGVSVRVILDADIDNKQSKRLIDALNTDNFQDDNNDSQPDPGTPLPGPSCTDQAAQSSAASADQPITDRQAVRMAAVPTADSTTWGADRSYVKKCAGSCRGAGGNMHSKFYLFSATGTASDVVMVSSANINKGGALNGWNDLYTIQGRQTTYDKYVTIHREMTEDTKAGDGLDEVRDGPYTSRFFPMRSATKANDPTLQDLKKIGCRSPLGRTRINVSMFYWDGTRGNYLADKLLSLARSGCRVSIVYGAPSVQIATRLRDAARRNLINLWDSRWDFNNDGYNEVRTHAKYVLVKGSFAGDPTSWQVWTGSQNWVAGSLSRGDEVSLNIAKKSAYRAYLGDWNAIRKHSRRLPYHR